MVTTAVVVTIIAEVVLSNGKAPKSVATTSVRVAVAKNTKSAVARPNNLENEHQGSCPISESAKLRGNI